MIGEARVSGDTTQLSECFILAALFFLRFLLFLVHRNTLSTSMCSCVFMRNCVPVLCVSLSLCLCVHGHNDHPLPMCWVCIYFRIGNGGRHTFTDSVTTAPRRDARGHLGVRGGNKRLFRGQRRH